MTTITGQVLGPDGHAPAAARDRQVVITLVDLSGVGRTGYLSGGEIVTTTTLTAGRDGAWSAAVTGNAAITSDWGTTLYRVEEGYSPDRRGAHATYINVPTTGGPYWIGDLRITLPGGASPQLIGYLPLSGGTMTGPITLAGDPATALQPATKQYVDAAGGGGGGGAVSSVNGLTGAVVLTASNVGAIASGARNAANGVAGLDGSSLLSASQVPTLDASKIGTGTLGSARIPDLSATYLTVAQRGAASGVASLDGSTLVPAVQLPVLTVSNISVAAPGNSAVGDTAAAGTATSLARSDHRHGREAFATPGNSAVGDTAAAGSAVTLARSDHTHGREAFGAATSQTAYGASSANGTAVTLSRSDHAHGTVALTSSAPGNSAVGDTAAVGTATTPARADHVHGREAFGSVTAQTAYGAASGNGVAVTLARSDHTHGTPAQDPGNALRQALVPAGRTETRSRLDSGVNATITAGTLYLVPIWLTSGQVIASITFVSGTTAAASPTHQWFSLMDSSRAQLATTTDDLTAAWATNTAKTLNIAAVAAGAASSFTATYTGLHYLGFMVSGTTAPSLVAGAGASTFINAAPGFGAANTGQATPPAFAFTAAAPTGGGPTAYAYVA